jgi:hypothetical protein
VLLCFGIWVFIPIKGTLRLIDRPEVVFEPMESINKFDGLQNYLSFVGVPTEKIHVIEFCNDNAQEKDP